MGEQRLRVLENRMLRRRGGSNRKLEKITWGAS
jgi:hypothetical protein